MNRKIKVAFTVWENRISPVFDSARMLLIAEIENAVIVAKHYEPFHFRLPFYRAMKLFDLEVTVLICGAISQLYANIIESYGIGIIPFVAGEANEILDAYLKHMPLSPDFQMPGCRNRRRRRFKRRIWFQKI
jgi:predicted Fe-Mo cluster-binding NifX family protein